MRNFTVGFVLALSAVLWASPNFAIGFAFVVTLGLLATPFMPRFGRHLIAGLCFGGLLAQLNFYDQLGQQFTGSESITDYLLNGTVISVPKQDDRRTSFLFRIDQFVNEAPQSKPKHISLSWYGTSRTTVHAGDQWQLVARLKPPTSLGNPGGFNYARWLFQNRIHATGYVRDSPTPRRLKTQPRHLHAVRQLLAARIAALPDANNAAALVQGLTVGITNNIVPEHWQTLRRSGTAHLLAISGLHIGLISGWFYFLAGFCWRLFSIAGGGTKLWSTKPGFALLVSCLSACVYAALAGFSLPTQRALIMLTVIAVASLLRRVWPPGSALLIALLLVLLFDQLTVLSVGFWLSFGTVLALFYLHNGRLSGRGKFTSALSLHLKLGVVLLPATAWFFQQGAFVAPLANAVAVPIVGLVVVPMSFMIAVFASSWPSAANLLLMMVQWLLTHLINFLNWLLSAPMSSVALFLPGPFVFVCVVAGLIMLFAPRGLRLRWLSVPLLAPAIVLNILGKPVRGLELHVLDVGQGLSAVLFTSNNTLVFDTGKSLASDVTMVDRVLQPFLVSQGRSSVDVSVVSHGDDDHAGGLESLLSLYPNTVLFSSDAQHVLENKAKPCRAGQSFVLDHVTFSFLHPGDADIGSKNNRSCVLLVHYGVTRILLTGDIEAESERLLIDRIGSPLKLTTLVAPHHGSRSSSTAAFVSLLQPDTVIYASGERNRFGFPHADVVSRYEKIGAKGYTTGKGGAVSMRFDQQGLQQPVEQFWRKRRRYRHGDT